MTVFSNSGPRFHDSATGKAGNSWIPTAIGTEVMFSQPFVRKSSAGFRNRASRRLHWYLPGETAAWYILRTPTLPLPEFLKFPGANEKCRFEPPDLYLTEADVRDNVRTCIVLNVRDCKDPARLKYCNRLWGSCFSVVYEKRRVLAISFRGPLRCKKDMEAPSNSCPTNGDDTLYAECPSRKMHFEILYGKLKIPPRSGLSTTAEVLTYTTMVQSTRSSSRRQRTCSTTRHYADSYPTCHHSHFCCPGSVLYRDVVNFARPLGS